jgi:two-component system chemotaxis response regulator CheB
MLSEKKVLIIDNSAFVRQFLKEILSNVIEPGGLTTVGDPIKALEILKQQHFDAITFDIEISGLDGLAFLQYILNTFSIPVVVISSATQDQSSVASMVLSLGVVAVIGKPIIGYKDGLELLTPEIVTKVVAAINFGQYKPKAKTVETHPIKMQKAERNEITKKIIVIGASTGGTQALGEIFKKLNSELPGIIVIQHMPKMFTKYFADTLSNHGLLEVTEAEDGQPILKGTAVVVPGGQNAALIKEGSLYFIKLSPREKEALYCPSINYTLKTVAEQVGNQAMGVILTGMGDDGAKGLRAMHDKGAFTIAQDQKTSVIFGMPQKAIENGAVSKVLPLDLIAEEINRWGMMNNSEFMESSHEIPSTGLS